MLHLPLLCHTGDVMRAAIYARVSTERQEREQTIDSQLDGPAGLGGGERP